MIDAAQDLPTNLAPMRAHAPCPWNGELRIAPEYLVRHPPDLRYGAPGGLRGLHAVWYGGAR